jgi:transposase
MKMANGAVEKVRRVEHKRLLKGGDDRLTCSKYFWLTSLENHGEKQHARFHSIRNLTLATGRACSCKELLRDLWAQETRAEGQGLLQRLVSASHSYQDGTDEKVSSEFEGPNR